MLAKSHFASLVRHFKKEHPHLKLSIRRAKTPSYTIGWCHKEADGSFRIVIRKTTDEEAQQLALVHELAHAISWTTDKHPTDHGSVFGQAYAAAWRSYMRWLNP